MADSKGLLDSLGGFFGGCGSFCNPFLMFLILVLLVLGCMCFR